MFKRSHGNKWNIHAIWTDAVYDTAQVDCTYLEGGQRHESRSIITVGTLRYLAQRGIRMFRYKEIVNSDLDWVIEEISSNLTKGQYIEQCIRSSLEAGNYYGVKALDRRCT